MLFLFPRHPLSHCLSLPSQNQVLWSARLTFNAYRRGMFKKGEEDYRWPLLRASMSRPLWELFTITFIAPAQNVLLACTAVSRKIFSHIFPQLIPLYPAFLTLPLSHFPSTVTKLPSFNFLVFKTRHLSSSKANHFFSRWRLHHCSSHGR